MTKCPIKTILKEKFGHEEFRHSQEQIIKDILANKDTLAIMPTGGGKSLCYQIPALLSENLTLVISPLISLMQDQVRNLKEAGISAFALNSSLSAHEFQAIEKKILNQETKLLYLSPEGLFSTRLQQLLKKVKISFIAIDEAHCMSQWGHEFRNDYMRLSELKKMFHQVPILALTATADKKTREDILSQLKLDAPKVYISSFDRPNIRYMIRQRKDEVKQLHHFITNTHPTDTGIVYCLSRKKVERITDALCELGLPAISYHAGLSSEQRLRNQRRFERDEQIIVVATIAFGMGIDRPDVRFVAHLDLPKSIEGYYQETGRVGRDGVASSAWMMYGLQDIVKLSQMLETTQAPDFYKTMARDKLDKMLALCESPRCRRQFLLNYFDQESPDDCANCDVCLDPPKLWDATKDAQKLLSTIYRTDQIFGATHIIDVLRGSKAQKTIEKKHDQLSVFGIGKNRSKNHWNGLIRQLLSQSFIKIKNWEYKNLALTQKAIELLKGQTSFEMRVQHNETILTKKDKSKENALSKHNEELFNQLKALRSKIATNKNVPPYVIFADKTLNELCLFLPRNEDEFLLVHGVGKKKCEEYGPHFLKAIKEYAQLTPSESPAQ